MALANRQMNRFACLEHFSSLIVKVSFKKNSMSLGLVVLEKLFKHMRTPQSDNLTDESADIKTETHNRSYRSVFN